MANRKTQTSVSSERLVQDLEEHGGFTVHNLTGDRPAQGYAVADFGAEKRIPAPGAGVPDVEAYRAEHSEQLAGDRKFFGGWRNTNDGRGPHEADYLDVSTVVGTRREAFAQGQQTAQRAVMDLGSFEESFVPFAPSLPGPKRTGQSRAEFRAAQGQNWELGRQAVEHQLLGRADPSSAREHGAAIADALIERQGLHEQVRGMHPRAQVKRGRA